MRHSRFLSGIAVLCLSALPAAASSSAWHDTEGGRVRLVTTGQPDAQGRLQGALDIQLKPGWKTYWRDPGDSGVPPQLTVEASPNVANAQMSFPAPRRHDDGYGQWAGYDHSVSLPVTFTLASPQDKSAIDADIFIGICETICIPVQARLEVDPGSDPDNDDDAQLIKAATAALPPQAHPGFQATPQHSDHETLVVEAEVQGDPASADFFIAGADDYMFGAPKRSEKDGKLIFSVPILDRPGTAPDGGGLHYTLTSSAGAVRGLLPYP
ncbi:protein-disulfide reductase DsbD domain-containing protein [Mesorhizobium sp. SP-1A]|uniref:protein-disulfide reductase DsbD domain-containing protein n=1 Tax=Mesorhizobium sp. SP-1A TaxID=3077840 RepID=UPI0028F74EF2|nr:protein-disulfide reductase DsbD domain-containing protein [Mesorhizobium sp. SP-1A]